MPSDRITPPTKIFSKRASRPPNKQPGQDIASFLCNIRTLARRAYRAQPALISHIVLTSFIEGLSDPTLRWELRKAEPRSADDALSMAIELHAYLELEGKAAMGSTPQTLQVLTNSLPNT